MDSHPELILALYVLYYFGTKKYDDDDASKKTLRNIKNYEEEIFKFRNWQDFLDSISSGKEKYNRTNKNLRKMAEGFFTRWKKKDSIIKIVIDNYKNRGVFSSKEIDKEKDKTKNDNSIRNKNKINETKNQIEINGQYENQNQTPKIINNVCNITMVNQNQNPKYDESTTEQKETGKINQHNKTKIGLIILTVLIFLLLICAVISGNPIFIKTMMAITLIYVVSIIILICYRDHISKNEARKRITFNKDMKEYGRKIDKSLNLNYESDEKINITQQYTNYQENGFRS